MLCEGEAAAVADDHVVQNPYIDERERVLQPPCDQLVRLAWLDETRRVIVSEDDRRRVVHQGLPHDLPWMDACAVDRSPEHLLESDEAMAVVDMQAAEHLERPVPQLCEQKSVRGVGRR